MGKYEKLVERTLLGTALAMLAGYLGLAWAIGHQGKPKGPTRRKSR